MLPLEGKTCLVTGAARGIGRAIALAMADAGCNVCVNYSTSHGPAEEVAKLVQERGRKAKCYKANIAVDEENRAMLSQINDDFGIVQILVNNAGIRRDAIVGSMKPSDWQRVLDVNLTGSFLMSKFAVLSMMRRRYGRIVMITSPAAEVGFQGQAAYAASKAGQQGLMRSLAREVAKRKITVNCVSPGFIDTELLADLTPEQKAEHLELVPLARFGTPAEVAHAVSFLCSPRSGYVHGTTLEVTGGI